MRLRLLQSALCFSVFGLATLGNSPALADACTDLSTLSLPEVTSLTASSVPANSFTPPGTMTPVPTAFCRVQITVAPQIKIEVWLPPPANWNHRFQAEGGGGYAGSISYSALARAVVGNAQTGQYATASTDTGHPAAGTANGQGGANGAQGGGGFALDPVTHQLNDGFIVDFASRSLHEMTVKAKILILAYYGRPQTYSYWVGCSTGGRQGWMEAQRFPEDYDGILAGAPAFNWDRFIPAELWPEVVMNRHVGAPIPMAKLNAVNAAAVLACDELDGVKDGVISDPRECPFSPWSNACGQSGAPTDATCLTPAEAQAVAEIWEGARAANGDFLWYGLEPGASFGGLAGSSNTTPPQFTPFVITLDHWRLWLMQNPAFDWTKLDPDAEISDPNSFERGFRLSQLKFHSVIGTDDAQLTAFRNHGGKMITYHGWNDQLIFPRGSIDYYERVLMANGGLQQVRQFARLFMVAGMNHCTGGVGAVNFGQSGVTSVALDSAHDAVLALQRWVEQGVGPDQFIATSDPSNPKAFTRPLCPYPDKVHYIGGDQNNASSFTCESSEGDGDHDD